MLTSLRSKAQQFDFSRLFNALDELEQSFRDRVQEEVNSFNQDNVQYETDKAFFGNQVTQFSNEVNREITISVQRWLSMRTTWQTWFTQERD